jgi:hypothetical protein
VSYPPLVVQPGDSVAILERDVDWPAFVFVESPAGERGWVPERYLRRTGERGVVLRRYDTTQLDPSPGDLLDVLETDLESGWYWCRDSKGAEGWFPINHLAATPTG